jgi:thiopeptide-type bacteriocin biosynthesis protein
VSKNPNEKDFIPSPFFAFRTPLLPYEELEAWEQGLEASGALNDPERLEMALAADRARLRARLEALLARPEILEAVFLASPSLHEGLSAWRKDPDGKKGQRAERALVRYFYRMAARATPFGLFSGCSLGRIEDGTEPRLRIAVAPRPAYERHTRLDMDYLFALAEDLGKDRALREELAYRPNSSLYRAAGRLRYAEARLDRKIRSHHLVAVDTNEFLEEVLRRASGGAQVQGLVETLVAADPDGEVSPEEAREFVHELIDSQILVSDLSTPVTGPEAIHDLIEQLGRHAATREAAERLARVRDDLAALDAGGPGAPTERYQEVADRLKELPTPVEMSRLFQLDLVKPGEAPALSSALVDEALRGVEILWRLSGSQQQESLDRFRSDFNDRYESREVPLLEALDEEIGIGFEKAGDAGAEASPLLRGMALARPAAEPTVPWGRRQAVLLQKIDEARARGERQIEITADDLERMAPTGEGSTPPPPLPDAFHAMVTISAPSEEALERGDFQILFDGAGGPSGARLLGRFCHADPELTRCVEEHLRAEEALRPDATFAEVVHLPQGRIGNILARPVLREYEIPYLGRSGAPLERQIPVSDLRVTVEGSRIVLRSQRLGREVIPRLTSAHNFWRGSLGVYRFLGMLQSQGCLSGVAWNWGPLDNAPFLPRVTSGRLVLSRAAWWMTEKEIKELAAKKGTERFQAVQEWRERRGLPRLAALADADNELLVDFDNVLSVETFLDVVEGRDRARLFEFFPEPGQLFARGPEGRFVHEILVPFVRRPKEGAAARPARSVEALAPVRRAFAPGSEWLYVKLYTGSSTADGLLRDVVAPVAHEVMSEAQADAWFFIRYGDPGWHLRVRFHGDPGTLVTRVFPRLQERIAPLLDDGRLWRVQLDTYEREVERYGGPEGIVLTERLFHVDSEAVLAILDLLEGDEGADFRWRITLRGIDMLLNDLGLEGAAKQQVLRRMRESFATEFGGGKGLRVQLDQRLREERRSLFPLLDPAGDRESELAPALEILHQRSERWAPLIAELKRLEGAGRLTQTIAEIAPSYVHMFVNRMIRAAARAHELVLYDFLYQLLEQRAARARKGG